MSTAILSARHSDPRVMSAQPLPLAQPAEASASSTDSSPYPTTVVILVETLGLSHEAIAQDLLRAGCSLTAHNLAESTETVAPGVARDVYAVLRRRLGHGANAKAIVIQRQKFEPEQTVQELVFAEMTIDRRRYEVRTRNQTIMLTKAEFDLLFFLANQSEVVLTRREIIDQCHGAMYPVTDRSIDVQILSIRRKLGPAHVCLQTVRGVGYRFVGRLTR